MDAEETASVKIDVIVGETDGGPAGGYGQEAASRQKNGF